MTTQLPEQIVPAPNLEEHAAAIRSETDDARRGLVSTTPAAETALRYYLVFSDAERATRAGLGTLDEVDRFYNRYYWFKQFAKLHQAAHGPDAGIEQQAFQLLEQAPPDVDWSIVERLD